jgi:dipeptidyl aminopeptidase/acylaminoacyl peptidase
MVIAALLAATALSAAPAPFVSPSDLVTAVDISDVTMSPDGRMVAFRTEEPSVGDNQIHLNWRVVPVNGSEPARQVADGGGPELSYGALVSRPPVWAPSSRALYVRAGLDGEVQIWRASIDGGAARPVTTEASDVRSLSLSPDGQALRYDVGLSRDVIEREERNERDNGVLIDDKIDVPLALLDNGVIDGHITTLRFSGHWLLRQPLLWDQDIRTKELSLPSQDLAGAPAAASAAISTRIETVGETRRLHAVVEGVDHLCGTKLCLTDRIVTATVLRNGSDILVTTRDSAMSYTLSIWTPASGRWRVLTQNRGALDNGDSYDPQSCAIGDRAIACVAAAASEPPRLVSIDLASGRMTTLFDPNNALRARTWPTELLRWDTPSGLHVTGQLFLPEGKRPAEGWPLVMNYYNCAGFLKGGIGDELPLAPLAQAGIAALCINEARGPMTSEHLLQDRAIEAVTALVDRLSRQGLIDRSRVGMSGLSFGSEALMAIAERTNLLRAAAISSGQTEPAYYWMYGFRGAAMRDSWKTFFGLGDPDTDKAGWAENATVSRAASIKAPLLIQIPDDEMRTSMELYSKLIASPTPVEMVAFANETHIKWQPRHKLAVYERNLDWFRFWLLGEKDPDPAKAAQYARWQAFSARPGFALPVKDHTAP